MKRCTKCILPLNYPNISFDKEGVCNYCHTFKPVIYKGENALKELFYNIRSQSEWDCLVPLSGGRDSTYTLFQLVKKYKLRALAYNYDNGFVEQIAKDNIQNIADQLNIKIIHRNSTHDLQCKNVKYITKLKLKQTPGHVQSFLCSGCRNGIWGGAYATAKKYNVPMIIFGESTMESGTYKKIMSPQFVPTLPEKISFMLRMPINFIQRKRITRQLQAEFPLPPKNSEIMQINFFDYEEWNEKKILDVIQNKLQCQQKKGQSSWRFDCQIHALVNRMTYQIMGMTEKDELYSKMIREGQITREQALEKIKVVSDEQEMELNIIETVLSRMELNAKEKDKIRKFCQGPPKLKNSWL